MEKTKQILIWIGVIVNAIVLGGLRIVFQQMTPLQLEEIVYPILIDTPETTSFTEFKPWIDNLSNTMGIAIFILLILFLLYRFLEKRRRYIFIQTLLILGMFLCVLIGSDYIAYPTASFFFIALIIDVYQLREKATRIKEKKQQREQESLGGNDI